MEYGINNYMTSFHFSKNQVETEFKKALEMYQGRLLRIHTGQANPSFLEDVMVTYQGFEMKLQELASIRSEGPRTLVVEPWDKGSVSDIEKALFTAKRNINPQVRSNTLYVNFPSLTEEMRKQVIKDIHEIQEDARIKIRHIRDEYWEQIKNATDEGELREDDKFKFKDELQKLIDDYNKKIEETTERKIKALE